MRLHGGDACRSRSLLALACAALSANKSESGRRTALVRAECWRLKMMQSVEGMQIWCCVVMLRAM